MPVWRCPHCGTPQEESSRCWVCRRSTTTCATCRHFRRGVANGLGLCGLDPRHSALDGTEIRTCWTASEPYVAGSAMSSVPASAAVAVLLDDRRPARTFVPVEELAAPAATEPAHARVDRVAPTAVAPGANGWSLWGDADA